MYTLIVERKLGKVAFPVNTLDLRVALDLFIAAEEKKYSEVIESKHFSFPPIISAEIIQNYTTF